MSMVDWYIEGDCFGNCNCDWSCPCQFELLPSQGNCQGIEAFRVDKGHFGDVQLDGLKAVITYSWPGPIFEGNGETQAIIDERADEAQRKALLSIVYGEHTNAAATHFWVYHTMSSTVHDPIYKPIELECDIEARTARLVVPDLLESIGSPIRSPHTGDPHRIRLDMPEGIEFAIAEIGNASTSTSSAIKLDLENSFGQWNRIRMTGAGVVRS
jgi:hypothetical protein